MNSSALLGGRLCPAAAVAPWLILGLAIGLFWMAPGARAASAAERRAFRTATTLFHDGFWELAEKDLADFIRKYPDSEHRAEAMLMQGQARFRQAHYRGTVELLEGQLSQAGPWADEFRFWIAEADFQQQNFAGAADHYARLLQNFPKSARRLAACYGEALCRFKLQDWARVKELLTAPQSAFQLAAKTHPHEELVVRGYLLLGEALFRRHEFAAAEAALQGLADRKMEVALAWQRQYLLCRIALTDQRPRQALEGATNLFLLTTRAGQQNLLAESVTLQGAIYEQLRQPEEAVRVYESHLERLAPEPRRQALLKIIELTLAQNKPAEAMDKLEAFCAKYPADHALDLAQLTLGELRLKGYFAQAEARRTNDAPEWPVAEAPLLKLAQNHFNKVVTDFPQSPLWPKAQLDRGWCLWLLGNMAESQTAFRLAAERLPFSEDQALARFKLADTELWSQDYSNALKNYRMVVTNYAALPAVKTGLWDQAFYQILRTSIALGDLAAAEEAMGKLLGAYPDSFFAERSLLLVGQALNRVNQPARARQVFADFVQRFSTNSAFLSQVELAIARTFVQEENWNAAIKAFDDWAAHHTAGTTQPQAEFDRAWVYHQAGQATNALRWFTHFVARYPAHELAQQAQFWIGGFYFSQQDYTNAETHYQLLFQNTNRPPNELTYQARMMAGRAALARQGLKDAGDYFRALINDEKCPPEVVAMACFALGDTLIEEPAADLAKAQEKYNNAIVMLNKIPQMYPTNRLVPAVWGRIGDCYLQLAAQEAKHYDNAAAHYLKAVQSAGEVEVRSKAEVGLGLVLEKQAQLKPAAERPALLKLALEHYLNVVYGNNLRLETGEKPDPFWLKKAGLAAAALAESQRQWETAIHLYSRLKSLLPSLGEFWDKKAKAAREQLEREKG